MLWHLCLDEVRGNFTFIEQNIINMELCNSGVTEFKGLKMINH